MSTPETTAAPSRRSILTGSLAAAAGGSVLAGGAAALLLSGQDHGENAPAAAPASVADSTVPFYGARQAGVVTPAQAFASMLGFRLRDGLSTDDLRRLLRVLTEDSAALAAGTAPFNDVEPEMVPRPASLTVTFGFGERVFDVVRPAAKPAWLAPLPAFRIDELRPQYTGGDLFLQVCGDDELTVRHAARHLLKACRTTCTVAWIQDGFRQRSDVAPAGVSQRNLFGQVDGSANPRGADLEAVVFGAAAGGTVKPWTENGTSLVLRRIDMNLDTWDRTDRPGREAAVGRTLDTGAPLTGGRESDPVDLEAKGPLGFPVIPAEAHARRAAAPAKNPEQRMHRRVYNYEVSTGAAYETGLLFASYQADVARQFLPVQKRLAELDALNQWTTPIGSAVFAIPPGCSEGGFIGDFLF